MAAGDAELLRDVAALREDRNHHAVGVGGIAPPALRRGLIARVLERHLVLEDRALHLPAGRLRALEQRLAPEPRGVGDAILGVRFLRGVERRGAMRGATRE